MRVNAAHMAIVAGLLMLLGVRHYGYALASPADRAVIWNICGSLVMLALVWGPVVAMRQAKVLPAMVGRLVLAVAAWWTAEEIMVAGCDAMYLYDPWPVPDGADMCSSLTGADIGLMGSAVLAALALAVSLALSTCKDV